MIYKIKELNLSSQARMENVTSRMESVRIPNILKKGNERQSESTETNEKEKGEKKPYIYLAFELLYLIVRTDLYAIHRSHSKLIRGFWDCFLLLEQRRIQGLAQRGPYPEFWKFFPAFSTFFTKCLKSLAPYRPQPSEYTHGQF